jgi:hypothetical protein
MTTLIDLMMGNKLKKPEEKLPPVPEPVSSPALSAKELSQMLNQMEPDMQEEALPLEFLNPKPDQVN